MIFEEKDRRVPFAKLKNGDAFFSQDPNPYVVKDHSGFKILFSTDRGVLHWIGTGLKKPHVGSTKYFRTRKEAEAEIMTIVDHIYKWKGYEAGFIRFAKKENDKNNAMLLIKGVEDQEGLVHALEEAAEAVHGTSLAVVLRNLRNVASRTEDGLNLHNIKWAAIEAFKI